MVGGARFTQAEQLGRADFSRHQATAPASNCAGTVFVRIAAPIGPRGESRILEAESVPFAGALKREKNMLQVFAERFRRCVRALVLPVVVLALIFAAPSGAFAADDSPLIEAAKSGDTAEVERLLAGGAEVDHQGAAAKP